MTTYKSLSVRILGTGHAVPKAHMSSEMLDQKHGFSRGYLAEISGVNARYVCTDETQIDLGVIAATRALERAKLSPNDVDLVIGACAIPYQTLPASAPIFMRELGIQDGHAAAYDINSTCLSFVNAVDVAAMKIATGAAKNVLIISSEIASRALPWDTQPDVAALFGDGAGAAILGPISGENTRGAGIKAAIMRSFPSVYDACEIAAGGTRIDYHTAPEKFAVHARFAMDGKSLFRVTAKHFPGFVNDLLARAGWAAHDVDVIVPHQASPHALTHMARLTGFAPARIINIAAQMGNQIAASIPTALDIAWRDGRIKPQSKVLLLGTSAGVSFGGIAIET